MTQEEKAKRYDEALERARKIHNDTEFDYEKGMMEEIFPELSESEDEKVRKALIRYHKATIDIDGIKGSEIVSWIEKQGGKTQGKTVLEAINEEKVDNTNKAEPKFKASDWIVDKSGFAQQVLDFRCGIYVCTYCSFTTNYESNYHLWTIADAKDGDVLCYKDEISLFKHDIKNCTKQETTFGGFVYYCCYDGKRFITDSLYSLTEQDKIDIHPATKEQRDAFFAKMKNAGYDWDADKKELEKNDQNSAWSEEDELNLKGIIDEIEANKNSAPTYDLPTYERFLNWLKSLRNKIKNE